MKTCTQCLTSKHLSEFNKKTEKRFDSFCRACRNKYQKEWYQKNKKRHIQNVKRRGDKFGKQEKIWLREFKKSRGCIFCSESHPAALHMHHKNPEDKKYNISRKIGKISRQNILKEMEKCDIVCANCHAKLHYEGVLV